MYELSVIIPTYNRGSLVRQAVESVLDQETIRSLQVIVVDDGSTDDTETQLVPFGTRIEYIRQANRGVNAARNTGLRAAQADLIAFLDSDDVWLPFKVDLQLSVLEQLPDAGFAFSDFFIWRNGERIPNGLQTWMEPGKSIARVALRTISGRELGLADAWRSVSVQLCDIYGLSLSQPVVLPSTSIMRRKVLEVQGFLPEDTWMCGDWEYFARACRHFPAAYIDIETTLNRSHDDGVRLMRRDLSQRTLQRIASIARLWKSDPAFMADHATEVALVESREWNILFKQACLQGRLDDARKHRAVLAELHNLTARDKLLYLSMSIPPLRRVANWIRGDH